MCMPSAPKTPQAPPPQAPDAAKVLLTPDQADSNSLSSARGQGTAKRGLRIDIGGSSTGTGLNIPTN